MYIMDNYLLPNPAMKTSSKQKITMQPEVQALTLEHI